MDSLCHPCITTTHLSYSALSLKLPPPPCAGLLVIRLYTHYVFTSSHLTSSHLASSHLVHRPLTQQSLQKVCPSTVLLRTAKLAQRQEGARGQAPPLRTTKFGQSTSQYYFVLQSLQQTTSQYYFVLQSLHKVRPSTSSDYKACTKYFPVQIRTTKFQQNTSKYYFVLCTTSYFKVCRQYFPVLLCTTRFAVSTSQFYFVLQSLHKVHPSTTSYYKVCRKNFPVPLCTTRFAASTSQFYFVLQNLHKVRPSTTSYYKPCTGGERGGEGIQYYFVLQNLHKVLPYAGPVQAVTLFIGLIPVMSSVNDYSLDELSSKSTCILANIYIY